MTADEQTKTIEPSSADAAYAAGWEAGYDYCTVACNDGLDKNPYAEGSADAEQWRDGFNAGVEAWEASGA